MPSRALAVCSEPGCAEIATAGGRCEKHQRPRKAWAGTENRPSASQRYGADWPKVRAAVLAQQPECALCGAPATDVDHIVPKRWGGTDDADNLQPLCKACHKRKTARGR